MHTIIVGGTKGLGKELEGMMGGKVSVLGRSAPTYPVNLEDWMSIKMTLGSAVKDSGDVSNLIFCQRYKGTTDWDKDFAINVNATKQVIEALKEYYAKPASIVIVSSNASHQVVSDQPISYHATKAALDEMTRYYAVELGPQNIRVNAVAPGAYIKEESREHYLKGGDLMGLYAGIIPIGRMIEAREVANVIKFLCSSDASAITGQVITVDGGLSVRSQVSIARQVNHK